MSKHILIGLLVDRITQRRENARDMATANEIKIGTYKKEDVPKQEWLDAYFNRGIESAFCETIDEIMDIDKAKVCCDKRAKWCRPPRSLTEALDVLDIDKNRYSSARDRRGAIKYIRNFIGDKYGTKYNETDKA